MPIANRTINILDVEIANHLPFVLFAGPCQVESHEHLLYIATTIRDICERCKIPFVLKSSYDKANRTSALGARGLGLEKCMDIFLAVKKQVGCPIMTDVHEPWQCRELAEVVDCLQIPAFLCRQTDLLVAAGNTGLPVNIKKGQFLDPRSMKYAAEKVSSSGNSNVICCERGTCFGYNTLINDMRSLTIMGRNGYPVMFDVTHSVQQPSNEGSYSGGKIEFHDSLARAAIAVGVSSLLIETHELPERAPSDSMSMMPIHAMEPLLLKLQLIDNLVKSKILPSKPNDIC